MSFKIENIIPPKNFVSIHNHSHFSIFDGLGTPQAHIDFVLQNGLDSHTFTEHGNANSHAHAREYSDVLKKQGRNYRQLLGVEFYFVPDLQDWKAQYAEHREKIKAAKAKKAESLSKEDVSADNEETLISGGHVIEDEEETKKQSNLENEWKRRYHLVVVARDKAGLASLYTLVKKSYRDGFYRYPRIDYKMLKEHGEGLIVTNACIGGYLSGIVYKEFPTTPFDELHPDLLNDNPDKVRRVLANLENAVDRFTDAVGVSNFFLEVQFNKLPAQHLSNKALIMLSDKTNIPLVATCDAHYPRPELWEARELYKKLGWMSKKLDEKELPKKEDLKCELYPKNAGQVWDEFLRNRETYGFYHGKENIIRDSIERTYDIAWKYCDDLWIDKGFKLPSLSSKNKKSIEHLEELVFAALKDENLDENEVYLARVFEELSDIHFLEAEDYFLTLWMVFQEAETGTLFGSGRGSGAGSLVNYLLKITNVDPIKHNLLWERFLGKHKKGSLPDIDSDASDRDVIIDAAKKIFGEESVIPISNFNTLKLKSLIKDISKFYDVPFAEVNHLTSTIQEEVEPLARDETTEKGAYLLTHGDCMTHSTKYQNFMEKYPEVEKHVEPLFLQNRSLGRHAGGVLIAPDNVIEQTMPLIKVRGELQTPWTEGVNARHLEANGFLKFDFLGLSLLEDIENCIKRILRNHPEENKSGTANLNPTFQDVKGWYDKRLNCRFHECDDKEVWKHIYHEGRFTGIFQFSQEGAREFCMLAKPNSIEDLAAVTAIYRPGPLGAGADNQYLFFKENPDQVEFDHPVIEEVLKSTQGLIIFQESAMILSQKLAGFTPGESDKLRKVLTKASVHGKDQKTIARDKFREKFVLGAEELHQYPREKSNKLFDIIENFSRYAFNKSHAISYAINSYYSAWLHKHFEEEWLSTYLQSKNEKTETLGRAIGEIKQNGGEFSSIDINESGTEWTYSSHLRTYVPPLGSIKGVGKIAAKEILKNRPYKNLDELFWDSHGQWKHSKMNKTCFKALCKIEAFNSLDEFKFGMIENHRQLLSMIVDGDNYQLLKKGRFGISKTQLKKLEKNKEEPTPLLGKLIESVKEMPDWDRKEKIKNYNETIFQVNIDLLYPDYIMDSIKDNKISSIFEIKSGRRTWSWFCITKAEKKKTKKGNDFLLLQVMDNKYNVGSCRVWGISKVENYEVPEPYTIWLGNVKSDPNWGFSMFPSEMQELT